MAQLEFFYYQEFILFAQKLNFAQAAKDLYISQPTLRHHMQLLEQSVGSSLITKKNNDFTLTSTGRLFLKRARELIKMENSILIECREHAKNFNSFSVGLLYQLWLEELFLDSRDIFLHENPSASLELHFSYDMKTNLESVVNGKVDIAIYPFTRAMDKCNEINYPELSDSLSSIYAGSKECIFWTTSQSSLYNLNSYTAKDFAKKNFSLW